MYTASIRIVALAALGITSLRAAAADGYVTHAQLSAALDALATGHGRAVTVTTIGASREGRAIHAIRVARPGTDDPDRRPALLIVAGIDGDHLLGSAVALELAARLAAAAEAAEGADGALPAGRTFYIVPRANPDAAERYFADVKDGRRRTVRPDDADRDGAVDEDPPNDLNGDGLITMMRVRDPKKADLMADPAEPRLGVAPDRDAGERAEFVVYAEGTDDDNDGQYNEDVVGGVDLDMNFMHGYQEHADGAGPYQVSEPESLALLEYVLGRQNIGGVLVYGRADNLSKTPDGKGAYPSGAPRNIDAKDVGLYKSIGERFREITGLEKVQADDTEGAFHAWAYAQFGVPAFTTPLWGRPEPKKAEDEKGEKGADAAGGGAAPPPAAAPPAVNGSGLTPSGIGDISKETMDELRAFAEAQGMQVTDEMITQITPEQVEGFARQAGVEIRRVAGPAAAPAEAKPAGGATSERDKKPRDAEEAAWLKYSDDERGGGGFVAWQKIQHSQLGEVEIGGWAPYFKIDPPPDAIDGIAGKQVEFVLDLAGRFPAISAAAPQVTRLAPGLYEVQMALVNEGALPTGTAMAVRNRRARPTVVRLSVGPEQVLTGQRVSKFWSIPGSGGRQDLRWIVRAADGSDLGITVFSEKLGEFSVTAKLDATGGGP